MNILNKKAKGLCNVCYEEIPARVIEEDGRVFLKKHCLKHGDFKGLIEKDANFYNWFIGVKPRDYSQFSSLLIPITYRCNMNCVYCFSWFPQRKDLSLQDILEAVRRFPGKGIDLSGGEPTVRDDLEKIIEELKKLGKSVTLVTNGLKLADINYFRRLKQAGLDEVFLSFDSFNNDFYSSMKTSLHKNALNLKKEALENLEREKFPTVLSSTIYPGLNDREIKDLFVYALKKSHFIYQVRFRNCVKVGRNRDTNTDGYFLSELLGLFSKQVGIDKETLKVQFLKERMGRSVIFCLEGYLENGGFKSSLRTKGSLATKLKALARRLGIKGALRKLIGVRGLNNLVSLQNKSSLKKMTVKLVGWPTVENIDLEELKSPLGYLCGKEKVLKVFHGMILEDLYN